MSMRPCPSGVRGAAALGLVREFGGENFERHVVDVLAGRAEPQPSGEHNLETLAMVLASYRSAETGATVNIDRFVAEGAR